MSRPPDEDFLSRWSRRKRAGDEEEASEPLVATPDDADEPAPPDETDEELLARLDLPDPDTMEKGDDFSRFMSSAVPEHIRRRALRRLWRSNPTLVVLDGLNEYDEDYTKGFVPAGTLKTAYKVGRGFLSRTEEAPAGEPPAEETPANDASTTSDTATYAPDNNSQEIDEVGEATAENIPETTDRGQEGQLCQEEQAAEVRVTRRRMQFRVPDAE